MNNNEETGVTIVDASVSNEVTYLQDKATIDVQIATAKAFPRNLTRSVNNAIAICTMDVETASTCTYSVPRGGKAITGPSVHLAKILAQAWGNMRVEAKVIGVEAKHVTCQAMAFDLENNLAIKVEVKRSIMTKSGRMNDDMIVVTGNAGNSIALRNAILAVIPKAVVDKCYNASKKTITGDLSSTEKLVKKRKQVLDQFKDVYGVTEEECLLAVGKASIEHIGTDEIVILTGIGTAIKEGDTTVEQAFKRAKTGAEPIEEQTQDEIQTDRIMVLINEATTLKDLKALAKDVPEHLLDLFNQRLTEVK